MSESNLIPSMIVAFAITAAFMFALRPVASSIGLIDRPGGRKEHVGDVPIVGGLAMFAGFFAGMVVIGDPLGIAPSIFVASLLLVVVGVIDDKFTLPAAVRFIAQIAAVLVMIYGANLPLVEIGDPFGTGLISMGRYTLIFTMLVTLTMINAYNLIDGVDGLAGSMAFIALLAIGLASGTGTPTGTIALTAAATVVGYLLFNFPVRWNRSLRAFMGDAGSIFLGFSIVWISLTVSQGPDRVISPVHCLWFASIPIYDSLTCFVRRSFKGKSPIASARDHFHHTLRRGSMEVHQVLATLVGIQAIYAAFGLIGHFAGIPDVTMFTAWSVLGLTQWWIVGKIARWNRSNESGRLETDANRPK